MKNSLFSKFRALAKLLALTLLLGTGQAQALPFLLAVPPVIKVASLFVGTIAGGWGIIETGKWAMGYEDPENPKNSDESDPSKSKNDDNSKKEERLDTMRKRDKDNRDRLRQKRQRQEQLILEEQQRKTAREEQERLDKEKQDARDQANADFHQLVQDSTKPDTSPLSQDDLKKREELKKEQERLAKEERLDTMRKRDKDNRDRLRQKRQRQEQLILEEQQRKTAREEQERLDKEKQDARDQANADFHQLVQDSTKPDTSPLSQDDLKKREELKKEQERLAKEERLDTMRKRDKDNRDRLRQKRQRQEQLILEEQQRKTAREEQERLDKEKQDARDQANADFHQLVQDSTKSDTSPLSQDDLKKREELKKEQERLAKEERLDTMRKRDKDNRDRLRQKRQRQEQLILEEQQRKTAREEQERLDKEKQDARDQANADFHQLVQDSTKSDTSPLSQDDLKKREELKKEQERLAKEERLDTMRKRDKDNRDRLRQKRQRQEQLILEEQQRKTVREEQERLDKEKQDARDQANADFHQLVQDSTKSDASPLSQDDLKKREELKKEQNRLMEEERRSKEKEAARDEANESFFNKMLNKFKQPQSPVSNKPEEEDEEEPETPPEDESNEDFINRTEEFEEELNDEDEKEKGGDKGKAKARKPDAVPKLNTSAETHLQGTRALAHGSALMTMETMSGFRNAMGLYRSGRAFSFGTASLDNVSSQELLASTNPVHQVPTFNREIGSWHNFVQVHGLKANRNQVAGLPGGAISGQGMTAGVFCQLNSELVTGMLLSAHKNTYGFNDGLGSGSLENVRIGPFLSWVQGDFHLDASLTLAHNDYSLMRKDSAGNALSASFSGHEVAAYTGMGYDIHMDSWTQGLTLTPMAELLFVRSRNGGYTEEGKSDEAMSVNSGPGSQLIARYGLEVSYLFPNLESPTELKVRLGGQRHNMASQNSGYNLKGGGSGSLSIPAFAEDATFVGLGFYRKVSDYSHISFNYNGTKSKNGLSHGLQLSFKSKF